MYFEDDVRRIDYVLAWKKTDADGQKRVARAQMREVFVRNLEEEGLETEYDIKVRCFQNIIILFQNFIYCVCSC